MNTKSLLLSAALAILAQALTGAAGANIDPPDKARIAIVGDADRLNIGQAGYCGKRTEIDQPSDMSFLVPGDRKTWFYIRSKFRTPIAIHTCEGDFSFTPVAGKLNIIRFTFPGETCVLELFQANPGGEPVRMSAEREVPLVCFSQ